MNIVKNCLNCEYAAEQEIPATARLLTLERPIMCIRNPPIPMAFHQAGGVALAAVYPPVNKNTVSCAQHSPRAVVAP